jgi:subtilisin family serine protease
VRSLIAVLLLVLGSAAWAAPITALLSLKKGASISAADLNRIGHHREVKSVTPVFSKEEQKILKDIQAEYLSRSWVLELKGTNSFDIIDREIRRKGLPLNLDWNEMKISTLDFTNEQWGHHNTGLEQVIDMDPMLIYKLPARQGEDIHFVPGPINSKKKIRVAVFDTGVDFNHPDLKGAIVTNPSECKALEKYKACLEDKSQDECDKIWLDPKNPEVDQDKNGYPMDCHGWSVTNAKYVPGKIMGGPDFDDNIGHGTHVAGIIAAIKGNGFGVDGVSSNVEILPVQVVAAKISEPLKPLSVDLDPNEPDKPQPGSDRRIPTLSSLVGRGMIYAIRSGAQVMNFSMGWPEGQDSKFMRSLVEEALSRGIIVVAAAGNDSTRALLRPCSYQGVICVGAHGPDGAISHFSNYGSGVDIFAPGLNILSTYPMSVRPIRFRKEAGYDFLSGTSQATPFISGIAAELLARGIPSKDVLARLIAGSRPVQKGLALTEGTQRSVTRVLPEDKLAYQKWGLGGLVDVERAMKVAPQPIIVPVNKEKIEVPWDRNSKEVTFKFSMKNIWNDVVSNEVQITADFVKPHQEAVRPKIVSLKPAQSYGGMWKSQEIREYIATLQITDAEPSRSRIPGDLDLLITAQTPAGKRSAYVTLEMTVLVTPQMQGADVARIPIKNMPQGDVDLTPMDQYFDANRTRREYVVTKTDESNVQIWMLQQNSQGYEAVGGENIELPGDSAKQEMVYTIRMDWNLDGKSDYIFGYIEDKSEDENAKVFPYTFYVFDSQMKKIDSFTIDNPLAQMPKVEIFWQRVGNLRMPSWVGMGRDPNKKRGLRDRWENPNDEEDDQSRFYYYDQNKKLKALDTYQDFHFIDILQPTWAQENEGRVPVLLAKNTGSEAKPSYIYEFATAEVINGKVENFKKINLFAEGQTYRNMLDTYVGRIISLNPKDEYLRGTFWFGEGKPRQQRLTTIDNQNLSLKDYSVGALRAQFDSALWVRGVFSAKGEQYAYVITNSEIQLHQLNKNRVAQVSLERYSFFGSKVTIDSYFPITMKSSLSDSMLPSLLVPEGTGLNRGVKLLAPVFAYSGDVIELVSPARLRFKTQKFEDGCAPMETPVFQGDRGTALDFYCKKSQTMIRANLVY